MHEHAIVNLHIFCCEMYMVVTVHESAPLSGKGVIAEIDDSKFGKMKYGRGKPVNLDSGCLVELKEERINVFKKLSIKGTKILSS